MRVLGRVRLSRTSDESTSVERQRELIENWANANDHQIVGWAEDLDVSGSVDPFATPSLGPWLTNRLGEWDILCAWKLDRIARRAVPLHRIFALCQDEEKALVCISDNIDLSTWVGRLIASVIAGVAEGELEAIKERTKASQAKLRQTGRWGGGKIFYGYRAEERDDGAGWELVPDEHASGVLRGIIDKVLAGQSTESIARELNEAGELSPLDYQRQRAGKAVKGTQWSNTHLRQQLKSKALLGHSTHDGKTVRDENGMPVLKAATPLIDQDTFDRLQTVLEVRSFTVSNRTSGASPLLGVAFCGIKLHEPGCDNTPWCGPVCDCDVCGKPLYLRQHSRNGKQYRYYQCTGGGDGNVKTHANANIIKADELEERCEEAFLAVYGNENVKEKVYVPADDRQQRLDEALRAAKEIAPLLGAATSATMTKLYQTQLEALDRQIAELEKLPQSSARWEWREQPETYADAWESADTEQRRQLLIKRKVHAEAAVPKSESRYRPHGQTMIHMFTLDMDPETWDALQARSTPD